MFISKQFCRSLFVVVLVTSLTACGTRASLIVDRDGPRVKLSTDIPDAIPRSERKSKHGNPSSYVVRGKRYRVMSSGRGYVERGIASWYGKKFHGRRTSNGEIYNMYAMTAAHKKLPLPSYVRVTNLKNGRSAVVRVNDRGPFISNRIIDLSYSAAKKVGIVGPGTGLVEVRTIDPRRPEPQPIKLAAVVETVESSYPTVYIQLGAFSNRQNAEQLKAQLTLQGVDQLQIQSATARSKLLYKVRIGPLASVNDADTAAEYLENLGMFDYSLIID